MVDQLSSALRTGHCNGQSHLHCPEKPTNALLDIGVMGSQFHCRCHYQAATFAAESACAVDISSQACTQASKRTFLRIEFDIESCQRLVDITVEGSQKESVLVSEGGVEAAP